MVITENFRVREDGVQLVRTYSDINHKIIQNETGAVYDEAIDVTPLRYTYSKSDEPIYEETDEIIFTQEENKWQS